MATALKKHEGPPLRQELLAVAGISIGLFLLLALISFSWPQTPGGGSLVRPGNNWCGAVGHFVAYVQMSFLGLSSLWLPVLILLFSVQFFSPRATLERLPYICAGSTGIFIASSGLLAGLGLGQSIRFLGRMYPTGGYLGGLLNSFLHAYFGRVGAVLFLVSLLLFSLMIAIRFSPYFWGRRLAQTCGRIKGRIGTRNVAEKASAEGGPRNKEAAGSSLGAKAEPEPGFREIAPVLHLPSSAQAASISGDEENFRPSVVAASGYQLPGLGLLDRGADDDTTLDKEVYLSVSKTLEEKLLDFGVHGKVVGISPGPVITTYEFTPAAGVKINKVMTLADDLALCLKAESVRIVRSIPGKAALGIEIPNPVRKTVSLREILASENFHNSKSLLTIGLGVDLGGTPRAVDLARMPHLLIAGATGSGKSVAINAIICSILFKATPAEVRMLMIDPKRIELSGYDGIPHLLHPVVVDPKMANRALRWAVQEMERRYQLMEELHVKSFESYNENAETKLPLIIIVIDELADLMMVASREVEEYICRLAQMARAAGMHLIVATQRPSVDVLTGLIKANFPTRISFKVASKFDSRTVLDTIGSEHLLGAGDMLFLAPGTAKLQRIQGAYVSEKETERIVKFLRKQSKAEYDRTMLDIVEQDDEPDELEEGEQDEKYDQAVSIVCETGQASISMLQRRLRVGYNRAARMIEVMEKEGIVGPGDGAKPREVLVRRNYT